MGKTLPVLVLLDHYPPELDNEAGDRFANVLSHVAAVCVVNHGDAVPADTVEALAGRAQALLGPWNADTPPEVVRGAFVAATAAMLAIVRKHDDCFPLPPATSDTDTAEAEEEEPDLFEWRWGNAPWGAAVDWSRPSPKREA